MKLICFARATPMRCASSTVRPQPGMTPTRACVSAKRARSEAMRKSQFSATSKPPVTATPLTAPISGLACGGSAPRNVLAPLADLGEALALLHLTGTELLQVDTGRERGIGAGEDHHVDVVVGVAAS